MFKFVKEIRSKKGNLYFQGFALIESDRYLLKEHPRPSL